MKCENCKQQLRKKSNYCSSCGQKNISELNVKFVFGEFFQAIFNVDSKLFLSLKYLVFRPGFLTKEYIEGKRVSYLPPIRIYLVLSFLFFFLISVFDFDEKTKLNSSISEIEKAGVDFTLGGKDVFVSTKEFKRMQYDGTLKENLDSLTLEMTQIETFVTQKLVLAELDGKGFIDVLRDQLSLFLLLFLPFFALLYGAVFSSSQRGIVGNLIFNLHLNSFVIFMLLLNLCVGLNIGSNDVVNYIWETMLVLYVQYYIIKAIMVFYERKWWSALYKYILLLVGYTLLGVVFFTAVFLASIVIL
tara:strand:+ start:1095 stop:2000 length:906 start_codon:yes stop_codon:yes gene_type:complete